ncbi:hypothetical protein FKM82_013640 [Ascaphus truei]
MGSLSFSCSAYPAQGCSYDMLNKCSMHSFSLILLYTETGGLLHATRIRAHTVTDESSLYSESAASSKFYLHSITRSSRTLLAL